MSVSGYVSVCPRRYLTNDTRDLYPNFWRMLPVAVVWSSSGKVTKYLGERAILGVFFPTDTLNALYGCIAVRISLRKPDLA